MGTSDRLIYGDFMQPGADVRLYDEVSDFSAMQQVMVQYLDEYNDNTSKKMGLVMFIDAIEHTARIARVIRKPGGHILNLGVGGSGRQSLSRLAAFICEYSVEQVHCTSPSHCCRSQLPSTVDVDLTSMNSGAEGAEIFFEH